MDKKWHYTEKGEYPVVSGKYEKQRYPQIPCFVQKKRDNDYCILCWNCTEEYWDDEDCDDYYCDKEGVIRWMYLDPIIEEE